jgi:vacuolar-type H+-ATPase subunit H
LEEELRLVFESEQKAKELLKEAEREVGRIKGGTKSEADALARRSEEDARKRGEELVSEMVSKADEEGEELRSLHDKKISKMDTMAASKMRGAVDLILRSVVGES